HDPLDGLLVSLRHHVRSPFHPHHHRHWHARRSLCPPGAPWSHPQALRQQRLAPRKSSHHFFRCPRLGLPHLYRFHLHSVAAFRHRQSVACHHRLSRRHRLPRQHGQGSLRLDHRPPHALRRRHHSDRRCSLHQKHLLAAHFQARLPRPGLSRFHTDVHLCRRRRSCPLQRRPPLLAHPSRRPNPPRGLRPSSHRRKPPPKRLLLAPPFSRW